jgi:hypothetical protein
LAFLGFWESFLVKGKRLNHCTHKKINTMRTEAASSSSFRPSSCSHHRRRHRRRLNHHRLNHHRSSIITTTRCLIRVEDDEDENNEDFRRSKRRNERRELLTTLQRRTNDEKYAKGVVERDDENASETNGGSAAAAAAAKEKMFQILRDSASWDPDVEKLLEGIDASDPDAIEQAIRKRFDEKKSGVYKPLNEDGVGDEGSNNDSKNGSQTPTLVFFRQVQTQNLWVWMEARNTIEDKEKEFFDEAIKSWFVVGKLGGYNVENQQCLESASVLNDTVSHLDYDVARSHDRTSASLFHAIGEVEYRGRWARVWMDLGTADEMALDVLINSLITLSREYVGIKQIFIGGDNENGWGTKDSGYGQDQGKPFEDFDPAFDEMFGDMRGMRGKPNAEDSNWMSR